MFESFNIDGLFFPVVSFSAGVKYVIVQMRSIIHYMVTDFWTPNPHMHYVFFYIYHSRLSALFADIIALHFLGKLSTRYSNVADVGCGGMGHS